MSLLPPPPARAKWRAPPSRPHAWRRCRGVPRFRASPSSTRACTPTRSAWRGRAGLAERQPEAHNAIHPFRLFVRCEELRNDDYSTGLASQIHWQVQSKRGRNRHTFDESSVRCLRYLSSSFGCTFGQGYSRSNNTSGRFAVASPLEELRGFTLPRQGTLFLRPAFWRAFLHTTQPTLATT